jgi:hypothetical protein
MNTYELDELFCEQAFFDILETLQEEYLVSQKDQLIEYGLLPAQEVELQNILKEAEVNRFFHPLEG